MPAIARSPGELVAANTVWTTGEGLGAFTGPFVAGVLMALHLHAGVAAVAAIAFVATAAGRGGAAVRACLPTRPAAADTRRAGSGSWTACG